MYPRLGEIEQQLLLQPQHQRNREEVKGVLIGWYRRPLQQMDCSIQKLEPKLNALVMEKQNLDRQEAVLGKETEKAKIDLPSPGRGSRMSGHNVI